MCAGFPVLYLYSVRDVTKNDLTQANGEGKAHRRSIQKRAMCGVIQMAIAVIVEDLENTFVFFFFFFEVLKNTHLPRLVHDAVRCPPHLVWPCAMRGHKSYIIVFERRPSLTAVPESWHISGKNSFFLMFISFG